MAHVQLAARVRQHRAGVELRAARVFDDAVGVARGPCRLGGTLDLAGEKSECMGTARRARRVRSIIGSGVRPPRAGIAMGRLSLARVWWPRRGGPMIDASRRLIAREPPHVDHPSHAVEGDRRIESRRHIQSGRLGAVHPSAASMVLAGVMTIASIRRSASSARSTTACAALWDGRQPAPSKRASGRRARLVHRATAGRTSRSTANCGSGAGSSMRCRRPSGASGPTMPSGAGCATWCSSCRARRAASPSVRSPSTRIAARIGWPQLQAVPQFRVADRGSVATAPRGDGGAGRRRADAASGRGAVRTGPQRRADEAEALSRCRGDGGRAPPRQGQVRRARSVR